MKEVYYDLKAWVNAKFKKPNRRFKYNTLEQPVYKEDKYSRAIVQLLVINTIVFLGLWLVSATPYYKVVSQHFVAPVALNLVAERWWTMLTSGFTHESLLHFVMNMMGLVMIAQHMKGLLNNRQVWFVYVVAVLLGSFGAVLYANLMATPAMLNIITLRGASAGVLGLLTVFVMRYPYQRVSLFFVPTTLKWLAYINIIASVLMMLFNVNGGGGAAHLAGMGFAWLFYTQLRKKMDLSAFLEPIYTFLSSLKIKKKKKPMEYKPMYSSTYEDLVKKTIR